jgi:two-component system sensor histidine kinase/response regulator
MRPAATQWVLPAQDSALAPDPRILRLRRRGNWIVRGGTGVAVALVLSGVAISWGMIHDLVSTADWVVHTYRVSAQLGQLGDALAELISNARGYALNAESRYVERIDRAQNRLANTRDALRTLLRDNSVQQARFDQLQPLLDQRIALAEMIVDARRHDGGPSPQVIALSSAAADVMDEIQPLVAAMLQTEAVLLDERIAARARSQRLTLIAIVGSGMLGALLVVLALIARERDVRRRVRSDAALREQTALLQSVLDNMTDALFVSDRRGRLAVVNRAARALFGAAVDGAPAAFATAAGLRAADGVTPVHTDELPIAHALRGATVSGFESVMRAPDGRDVWLSTTACPLRDGSGAIRGALAVCSDVTTRRASEQALQRARDAAEATSRARSEFLANMSHEIRTPMNGILGMTELVLDSALTPDQRRHLELVHHSAESLLAIINDILDFSKVDAGRLELDPQPFDLYATVDATLKSLAIRAHEKGLELLCRIDADVPADLLGDAGRLAQILVNLIGNAIKFTERGEIGLDVRLASRDGDDAVLHFAVRDTGIGIAADRQHAIFDAFVQADSSTTRRYGGTGLGLGIAARLVELMDGRIWLESAPGAGSTFHFTARVLCVTGAARTAAPPIAALCGQRVLVVDDSATNRAILAELLQRWGLDAVTVASAAAARDAVTASRTPFTAALIDVCMPGEDGWALAAWLRARSATLASGSILMSSAGESNGARRARALGGAQYLLKPVGQAELLAALGRALGAAPAAAPVRPAPAPPPNGRALRVLVAEDNPVNQELIRTLLATRGHDVTLAGDGEQAVAAWRSQSFDLILMDVQMPEMDGFLATAAIRAAEREWNRPRVPIIALTAHAMQGDRERCLDAAMDGYLAKPLRRAELFALLDEYAAAIDAAAMASPAA